MLRYFMFIVLTFSFSISYGQKTHSFKVTRNIDLPASKVWAIVGEDFGGIANSHPKIVSSVYNQGSITNGGEGVTRTCKLNTRGTKFVKEKQIDYDPENYSFTVQTYQAGKLPLNPDLTKAIYKVVPLNDHTCRFEFTMVYRTKPAFMGGLAKGKFKKTIADYGIAVEHYAKTGEAVNKDNFKRIKKQYKKQ